jgi:uncharacterized membrane protein
LVQQIVGTLVDRWYVIAFGVAFLVFATRHLGVKRMLLYAAVALGVGALAENGSVLLGFPYTRYTFNPDLRGHELWIFDVPLMVPMSYAFLAYFAFAAARLLVSGPFTSRGRQPILEYVLAVVLATWALWVIDPVSRLGRYHLVGELFHYARPGFWFGLPLGSQLGFFATSGILIALLTHMMRDEPAIAVAGLLRHPRLPALLTYLGEVVFMAGTAFVVARINGPGVAAQADPLVGTALIIAAPVLLVVAIYWRSLPRSVAELERTS